MGVIAVVYASVAAWQRLSPDVDVARSPVTTLTATPAPTSRADAGEPSPPSSLGGDGGARVVEEPCGPINTGLIDAIRECRVLRPASSPATPMPLVLVLHGLGGDVASTIGAAGLREAVARDGFAAVVPQGVLGSWNAGRCCGLAQTSGADDVTYLRNVVDTVSRRLGTDPARVFAIGFSNGGMMAYRLLCDNQIHLAGIVSVMGTDVAGCRPAVAASVLHIAGTGDTTVPYDGGRSVAAAVLGVEMPPVQGTLVALAGEFGCTRTAKTTREGRGVVRREWTGCRDGARVELVTLDGFGHKWPNGDPIDATSTALRFLGVEG